MYYTTYAYKKHNSYMKVQLILYYEIYITSLIDTVLYTFTLEVTLTGFSAFFGTSLCFAYIMHSH